MIQEIDVAMLEVAIGIPLIAVDEILFVTEITSEMSDRLTNERGAAPHAASDDTHEPCHERLGITAILLVSQPDWPESPLRPPPIIMICLVISYRNLN